MSAVARAYLSFTSGGIGNIVETAAENVQEVLDEAAVEGLAHEAVQARGASSVF